MKLKYIYAAGLAALTLITAASCTDDDKGPAPTAIASTSVTTKAIEGGVVLKWTVPTDANYYYVKVKYNVPGKGECTRLASVYSDSLLVDGLYEKYGKIDFTVSTVTKQGAESTPFIVSAQAGRVPASITDAGEGKKFTLTGDDLWTDDQETSEGPIADLVDGDASTYFHMSWGNPTPFPHYIVVDLKRDDVRGITFSYICRNNANGDNPSQITVLGSKEFNKSTDDVSKATVISTLTGLPGTRAASYTSAHLIDKNGTFRYLWLRIDGATSGSDWIALAELTVTEVLTKVSDPESEQ